MKVILQAISASAFLCSVALADENNAPELPRGIYGGNLESAIGNNRVSIWERWQDVINLSDECISGSLEVFGRFLSKTSQPQSLGRRENLCILDEINAEFAILSLPPSHNLDSIDGLFSERRSGWVNRYENGTTNISLSYTLTPLGPNFWAITMANYLGEPEFEQEEIYFWARDYTSLSWLGVRPSDVDGIENVQLISCTRGGCRSVYRVPLCRSDIGGHDVKIVISTIDESDEDLYLENYSHIHGLSEIFRQKFLEYSCK